ncbi:MAG: AAA family ATPase [Thiolinea sp.]
MNTPELTKSENGTVLFTPAFDATKFLPITITRFASPKATEGEEENLNWYSFCKMIKTVRAYAVKDDQPLIKMGTYDNISRAVGSALQYIYGIELDYDAEVVTAQQAADKLEELGILGLVCSTHSSTANKPRWRGFLPVSTCLPAGMRVSLAQAVDTLLGNIVGKESFPDKQIFFVGRNPDTEYTVIETRGITLDLVPAVQDQLKQQVKQIELEHPQRLEPKPRPNGEISPIDWFNNLYNVEDVLEKCGYERKGGKYLYPNSTTGSAGVTILEQDGKRCAYSHHPNDPLSNGKANDAFECFCILKHGGDRSEALKDAGNYIYDDNGVSLNKLNQRNYHETKNAEDIKQGAKLAKGLLEKKPNRFKITTAHDIGKKPPISWLVKRVVPREGLALIFGPSGTGKSFLVLDMLAAISTGKDWFGYKTIAVPTTYIPLEGQGGIPQRIKAYEIENQTKLENVKIISGRMNLTEETDRDALVDTLIEAGLNNGVICIDTLAASAPGMDENASTGMGALIDGLMQMQEKLGGLVLLIHHTGKDSSKNERGWSGLRGALDCSIKVDFVGENKNSKSWTISKAKDGEDGLTASFSLGSVITGHDSDGEAITSCVIRNSLFTINKSQEDTKTIINLIDKYYNEGKYIAPAPNSPASPYKVLKDDPNFPAGLDSKRTRELLNKAQSDGLIEEESYSTDSRNAKKRWKVLGKIGVN